MDIKKLTKSEVAFLMDATNLNPIATQIEIEKLCRDAIEHQIHTVCVSPTYVPDVSGTYLRGNPSVKICTVVGFPFGYNSVFVKEAEARRAINDGAQEIDFCLDFASLKSNEWDFIENTMRRMRDICKTFVLKAILETGYLNEEEIIRCCELAISVGIDYVKTSTGFGPRGATIEDVQVMKKVVGELVGIKAAGGIKTYDSFLKMVNAGATRIGCSAYDKILEEAPEKPEEELKVLEKQKKKQKMEKIEDVIDAEVVNEK